MLNYETLLSSYDDKLTLMQWLKKVEAALKDASAVSFDVNKKGDATLTFSITFEDGSKLESGEIVLQQGESVESAAIVNGHLILTLTNGDELDAGNMFDGNVNITGTLDVGNDVSINGDIGAGIITGSKLQSTGDISASGTITGGEIIENMTGYTFGKNTDAYMETIYAGAVKNGNKLTLVLFEKITPTETLGANVILGTFYVPADVYAKLYPTTLPTAPTYPALDIRTFGFYTNMADQPAITRAVSTEKQGGTGAIRLVARGMQALATNTTYLLRYEITFLLSENLAA